MNSLIQTLDLQFSDLQQRSNELIAKVPPDKLFWQPGENPHGLPIYSCGEYLLRSVGAVEQTFNGITAKLWDDPFEWTLPEELSTPAKVSAYFLEVEAARLRGFALLKSDDDLKRELAAPVKLKTVFALLLETLARSENLQGRAFATFRLFSGKQPFV